MIQLLPEQLEALRQLQAVCHEEHIDMVIIGATAYRVWVDDDRRTQDVDVAVAVDVDQFAPVTDRLTAHGWVQDKRREERWLTPNGARLDLIPVGEQARRVGYLTWPRAEMRMSVAGFDHVFTEAIEVEIAPGLLMNVASRPALALTKIVSYMDDPNGRAKDLEDVGRLMLQYELEGNRRFSDEVFEAGVDFDSAGAFLLGIDLGGMCTTDEAKIVRNLTALLQNGHGTAPNALLAERDADPDVATAAHSRVDAFSRGLALGRKKK